MIKPLLAGAALLALVMAPVAAPAHPQKTAQQMQNRDMNRDRDMRSDTPSTGVTGQLDTAAQNFLRQVWNIDNFEIQAGQQAQNKASTQAVQDYARMIVADHTNSQNDLKSAVKGVSGFNMPGALDREHHENLQKLSGLSGAKFEQQFRTQQIEGHEKALRLFQAYANNGQNAELKNWAQTSIAMLQRHYDAARALPHGGDRSTRAEQAI